MRATAACCMPLRANSSTQMCMCIFYVCTHKLRATCMYICMYTLSTFTHIKYHQAFYPVESSTRARIQFSLEPPVVSNVSVAPSVRPFLRRSVVWFRAVHIRACCIFAATFASVVYTQWYNNSLIFQVAPTTATCTFAYAHIQYIIFDCMYVESLRVLTTGFCCVDE